MFRPALKKFCKTLHFTRNFHILYSMKLSNKYTLVRIILAPVFLILFFLPNWFAKIPGFTGFEFLQKLTAVIMIPLLAFAEFTDFLDGYMARKRNEVSDFGKIFDPFADVILHVTTFSCFAVNGYLNSLVFILILYREFFMTFFRMVAAKKGVAIGARSGGKIKTVMYVVTGFLMLAVESCVRLELIVSEKILAGLDIGIFVFSIISLALAYISFFDYLKNFGSILKQEID